MPRVRGGRVQYDDCTDSDNIYISDEIGARACRKDRCGGPKKIKQRNARLILTWKKTRAKQKVVIENRIVGPVEKYVIRNLPSRKTRPGAQFRNAPVGGVRVRMCVYPAAFPRHTNLF